MITQKECTGRKGQRWCDDPVQPIKNFYKSKTSQDGFENICKSCKNRYERENRVRSHEYMRNTWLKQTYGITLEMYNEMLDSQEGSCKICKTPHTEQEKLAVDHCHKTGDIRGLLCAPCNHGLGKFRDNPEYLQSAASYLMKP